MVSSDPRNGEFVPPTIILLALTCYPALLLHFKVEEALDSGKIVIVPIVEDEDVTTPSRWKCVLFDEAMRHMTVMKRFQTNDKANVTCIIWDVS